MSRSLSNPSEGSMGIWQIRNWIGTPKDVLLHKLVNALLLLQPRFTVGTSRLWFLYLSRKFLCAILPIAIVLRTCCSPPSCTPRICNSFPLVIASLHFHISSSAPEFPLSSRVLVHLLHLPQLQCLYGSLHYIASSTPETIASLAFHMGLVCLWFPPMSHLSLSLSCLWGQQSFEMLLGLTFFFFM